LIEGTVGTWGKKRRRKKAKLSNNGDKRGLNTSFHGGDRWTQRKKKRRGLRKKRKRVET